MKRMAKRLTATAFAVCAGALLGAGFGLGFDSVFVKADENPYGITQSTFSVSGASVRLVSDEYGPGVKFHVVMDKTVYASLPEGTETGTVVLPKVLLSEGENLTIETQNAEIGQTTDLWFENADGKMESVVYVYSIPPSNYGSDIEVVGYVKTSETTVYYSNPSAFSMSKVAKYWYDADGTDWYHAAGLEDYFTFALTYNGGAAQDVVYGSTLNVSDAPETPAAPEGQYFVGWGNQTGTKLWDFDNDTVKGNVNLYPVFREKENEVIVLDKSFDIVYATMGGTATEFTLDVSSALGRIDKRVTGTLTSVSLEAVNAGGISLDGKTFAKKEYADGVFTLDRATIHSGGNNMTYGRSWGEYTLEAVFENETGTTSLTVPVTFLTAIINSIADFNNIAAFRAKNACEESYLFGGYYALGQDIDAAGQAVASIADYKALDSAYSASGATSWQDGTKVGFKGIIDGRGHNIDNLGMPVQGIVGILHTEGVVRNISFTNIVSVTANRSLLIWTGNGTVENIYVHCTELSAGNLVLGTTAKDTLKIKNCFFDVTAETIGSEAYVIGQIMKGYAILENVYCVVKGTWNDLSNTSKPQYWYFFKYVGSSVGSVGSDVYSAVQTREHMIKGIANGTIDVSPLYTSGFWTTDQDGLPVSVSAKAFFAAQTATE